MSILPRSKHCCFLFCCFFSLELSVTRCPSSVGWHSGRCGWMGVWVHGWVVATDVRFFRLAEHFLVIFRLSLLTAKCRSSKDTARLFFTTPPLSCQMLLHLPCLLPRAVALLLAPTATPLLTAFKKYFLANCLPKCCTDIETAPRRRQNRRRSQARAAE